MSDFKAKMHRIQSAGAPPHADHAGGAYSAAPDSSTEEEGKGQGSAMKGKGGRVAQSNWGL